MITNDSSRELKSSIDIEFMLGIRLWELCALGDLVTQSGTGVLHLFMVEDWLAPTGVEVARDIVDFDLLKPTGVEVARDIVDADFPRVIGLDDSCPNGLKFELFNILYLVLTGVTFLILREFLIGVENEVSLFLTIGLNIGLFKIVRAGAVNAKGEFPKHALSSAVDKGRS